MEQINFAILAGGNGKRLRPVCDVFTPKPFVKITPGKSLLRYSFEQLTKIIDHRNESFNLEAQDKVTLVVLEKFLDRALTEINGQVDYTITESSCQNTFNAILRLVMTLNDRPNQMLCILPCDQIIENLEAFSDAISQAATIARQNDSICLIATKPKVVSDQLGYIKGQGDGLIEKFFEKPTIAQAQKIIEEGALVNTSTVVATVQTLKNIINSVCSTPGFVLKQQSFDTVVLQNNNQRMFVVESQHSFIDVGTPESFAAGQDFINRNSVETLEKKGKNTALVIKSSEDFQIENEEDALYFAEYKVRKLLELIPDIQNKKLKILDFGCGNGILTEMLRRYFMYCEVSGCDVSSSCINLARKKYSQVKFFTLDSCQDEIDSNSYDLIIASEVFHHIPRKEHIQWLKKINCALNANGHFVLFELNPLNPFVKCDLGNDKKDQKHLLLWPWQCRNMLSEIFQQEAFLSFFAFFQTWCKFLRFLEPFFKKCPFGGIFTCVVKK